MAVLKKVNCLGASPRGIARKTHFVSGQASEQLACRQSGLNLDYRVKASTLMETLVATVLIIVVFMMASMTLNALFVTTIENNDGPVRQELLFLQYKYDHGKLPLPHYDEKEPWDIKVAKRTWQGKEEVIFSAVNTTNDKEITFSVNHE